MSTAKFKNSEFYSEQSHCGSSQATRRMLNLSVALVVGFGVVAGSLAVSRAQQAPQNASSARDASFSVFGGLEPLTASSCEGTACDGLREGLLAGHSVAGSKAISPSVMN